MLTEECNILRTLFSKYNYTGAIGIEIGSFLGRSAYEISNCIPNATLYCIDGWTEWQTGQPSKYAVPDNLPVPGTTCSLDIFLQNTKDCKNIITIKGSSPECVRDWTQMVDFVFLDALHTNPSDRNSIDFWLPKINRGGMFAGHDYTPWLPQRYPDIQKNVRYLETYLDKAVITFPGTTLWCFNI